MLSYLLRRLLLLPLTLFAILMINFVIINLAPGDPTSVTEVSAEGAVKREGGSLAFGGDMRYLQFREFYGLTLPILLNSWPFLSEGYVQKSLELLSQQGEGMSLKEYDALRIRFGDQARFIMPKLLEVVEEQNSPYRSLAARFFIRGGTKQAVVGTDLTEQEKASNKKIAADNLLLMQQMITQGDSAEQIQKKVENLRQWYLKNREQFEPTMGQKIRMFFFETRFFKYMQRVLTLDFGTMRNDPNKTVTREVVKRFKYSLTLSVIPMLLTLVLCQIFGFWMAYQQYKWPDLVLNLFFLILYAIPVFVVAPFLIEKVALNRTFPFTDTPIPISGFTSPESIYVNLTSWERLLDTLKHLILPFIAVMYGDLQHKRGFPVQLS